MKTFLEFLIESMSVEWPRDVIINATSRTIPQSKERPEVRANSANTSILIPFGKNQFNLKAFEKLFDGYTKTIIGWDDVVEFLTEQPEKRLKLLDSFLAQVYHKGDGMTFDEFHSIISNDNRRQMIDSILDQLEGDLPDGEQPWTVVVDNKKKSDALPEV